MAANAQRRKHERYPVDREVTVEIGGQRLQGQLVDVSDGGAFVRLSIDVELGEEVMLALADEPVAAHADVSRVAGNGFAIRFDEETVGRIMQEAARNAEKG